MLDFKHLVFELFDIKLSGHGKEVLCLQQQEHIGLYINIASHLIRRRADSFSARYGLTGIQSRILSFIADKPERDIFQRDIEQQFGIRRSSVTSVITNLEQNGFLKRQAVPGDARLKKLVLTASGMAIHREITESIREFEYSISGYLEPQEREQFLSMLKRIIENLGGSVCPQKATEQSKQGKDETTC